MCDGPTITMTTLKGTDAMRMSLPTVAAHLHDIHQAMSIKINNMVYEMQSLGKDVIVMSLGEAFFDIPLYSMDDLPVPAIYHYSHSRGVRELRVRLAEYYHTHYKVCVNPDSELIVTAGSKVGLFMALMSVLNPGDEVIVPEPAWVSYCDQVRLCHANPTMVPYYATVYQWDEYISSRTRAIVINSPHNPTGGVLTATQLMHVHRLAERHNLFIVADEAYSDFSPDGTFMSCAYDDQEKSHTIVCNSMSKNYGMSGWRIGYIIARDDVSSEILKLNQHLITCPATILEHYLCRHFDDILTITKPQIAKVLETRHDIAAHMDRCGLRYLDGSATFYFFVSIDPSRLTSEEFCTRLLSDHAVATVPGIGYGPSCDRFIRVSIGTETGERLKRGLNIIKSMIHETSGLIARGDVPIAVEM